MYYLIQATHPAFGAAYCVMDLLKSSLFLDQVPTSSSILSTLSPEFRGCQHIESLAAKHKIKYPDYTFTIVATLNSLADLDLLPQTHPELFI